MGPSTRNNSAKERDSDNEDGPSLNAATADTICYGRGKKGTSNLIVNTSTTNKIKHDQHITTIPKTIIPTIAPTFNIHPTIVKTQITKIFKESSASSMKTEECFKFCWKKTFNTGENTNHGNSAIATGCAFRRRL